MIKGLRLYWRDWLQPFAKSVAVSFEAVSSTLLGLATAICGNTWPLGSVFVGDLGTGLLTYAAISFGFSVTATALILAVPHQAFFRWLVTLGSGDEGNGKGERAVASANDAYSKLLFVFSWTSLLHWLLIVVIIVAVVLRGVSAPVFPVGERWEERVVSGVIVSVTAAALMQFLVALVTLAQFSRVFVLFLSQEAKDTANDSSDAAGRKP